MIGKLAKTAGFLTNTAKGLMSIQQEVERRVQIRTGRRVRNLTVELQPERVILRGRANCYHVKQLAQHAVRDILHDAHVENAIAVESAA